MHRFADQILRNPCSQQINETLTEEPNITRCGGQDKADKTRRTRQGEQGSNKLCNIFLVKNESFLIFYSPLPRSLSRKPTPSQPTSTESRMNLRPWRSHQPSFDHCSTPHTVHAQLCSQPRPLRSRSCRRSTPSVYTSFLLLSGCLRHFH